MAVAGKDRDIIIMIQSGVWILSKLTRDMRAELVFQDQLETHPAVVDGIDGDTVVAETVRKERRL